MTTIDTQATLASKISSLAHAGCRLGRTTVVDAREGADAYREAFLVQQRALSEIYFAARAGRTARSG